MLVFFRSFPARYFLALLLIFLFFAGCSADPEKKKTTHFKKAMVYLDQEDEKAAVIELRNAIQTDPKFADARYQLGLLYLKQGNPREAFQELQRAASLDPENIDARLKTAEFLLMSRDNQAAREHAEGILATHPENVDALALMANIELVEGNSEKAKQYLEKALSLEPNLDRLYTLKGRLSAAEKDDAAAEAAFRKAVEVNPDKLANHLILFSYYQAKGETQKAEEIGREMINRFPDAESPHIQLAFLYSHAKENDKAEQTLLNGIRIFPKSDNLRLILANFYRTTGQEQKAEQAYRDAIQHSESPLDIKAQLADYFFDLKKFDQAKQLMQEILAENPKNGGAKLVEAKFLLKDGNNRDALNTLDTLTRDYPRWADPFFIKSLAHMSLGEMELAQNSIAEAIKRNPRDSKYHTGLALLLFRSRDFDGTKREAAIALKLDPKNFKAALLLAKGVLFSKDYTHAIAMLEEMHSKLPENIEILGNLGLAYLGNKQLDKARQTIDQLLALQPENTFALLQLVRIGNAEGASKQDLIKMVRKQIEKAPNSDGDLLLLGTMLMAEKQYDEALAVIKKAQELAPQNPRTYALSAAILKKQKKIDAAIAEYEELLKQEPQNIPARMGIGAILQEEGDIAGAKTQYEKILTIQPDFAPAANNLSWIIAEEPTPDLGEALRLAMIAKEKMPDEVHIIDTLGWVHLKRQSYSLARNEFSQAVDKQPDAPVFRYHLALALYGEDKKEEAVKELQEAVSSGDFAEKGEAEELLKEWQGEQ